MRQVRNKHSLQRIRQDPSSPKPGARRSLDAARMQPWLAPLTTALVSGLLVVSFLIPADAKSVFLGEALPQNLLWLIAGILAALAAKCNRMLRLELAPMDWVLLASGSVWLILSCLLADASGNGRAAWNGFWQVSSLASCYAIVAALSRDAGFAKALIAVLFACSVAMSILGIHQVTVSFPRDRVNYAHDPDAMLRLQGLDAPEGSAMRKRFEDRLLSNEPFASFALANSLATVLSAGLILGVGVLISLPTQLGLGVISKNANRARANWLKALRISVLILFLMIVAACWILTKSRSSYVAVATAGVIWLGLAAIASRGRAWVQISWVQISKPSWIAMIVAIMVVVVLCGLAWMLASDRLVVSEAAKSLLYRLEYWQATGRMIADHWLWGVGLGNFQSYYPQYKLLAASEIIADPHNWLLDVAATMSVPVAGLVSYWLMRTTLMSGRSIPTGVRETLPHLERATWIGAGTGYLTCVAMQALTGQSIEWAAGGLAWSAAAICVYLLFGWIDRGELSDQMVLAAIFAMLVGLLASGSWQASGVGIPLMCLLGIKSSAAFRAAYRQKSLPKSLKEAESPNKLPGDDQVDAEPARWYEWSPVALAAVGLVVFTFHSWRPTSESWTLLQQSFRASSPDDAIELAQRAAAADPLDPAPLISMVQMTSARLSSVRDAAEFRQQAELVDVSVGRLLQSDAASHLNWQLAGSAALDAAAVAQGISVANGEFLEQAERYYAEASRCYPSSVQLRAQLATVLALTGNWPESRSEIEEAFRLSKLTPHDDQRLENQLIWLPMNPPTVPYEAIVRPTGGPNWAQAEPVANWLRTK